MNELCLCGSSRFLGNCCLPYIENQLSAPTPEALMRSRYTAYTLANIDYIQKTMRGPAANGFCPKEALKWAKCVIWLKLEVLHANPGLTKNPVL